MYYDFYQLKENPFNVTADPHFFFLSKYHSEAITNLTYGIDQRKGILLVTGEVGTGKTTLCRQLLKQMNNKTKFAVILNTKFSESQLLQLIVHDLGIMTKQKNKFALIHLLNEYLLAEAQKGNNVVLLIDEAQNLTVDQLEQIRLLSNIETEKEKLLQIILVGQPELHDKLMRQSLRQLRQRIAIYYHIQPLAKNDIKNYIYHRLSKASWNNNPTITFTEEALDTIYRHTLGSPRTINVLCDRALTAGYVADTNQINHDIIENCAKEVMYLEYHL